MCGVLLPQTFVAHRLVGVKNDGPGLGGAFVGGGDGTALCSDAVGPEADGEIAEGGLMHPGTGGWIVG